jgi:hypothetical protein
VYVPNDLLFQAERRRGDYQAGANTVGMNQVGNRS